MADINTNKAIARRYIDEVWNGKKTAVVEELLADHFTVKGAPYTDKAGERYFVERHHHAYPDMKFTVLNMTAEGDHVSMQIHGVGTHKGEWMGIKPTNKTVNVHGHVTFTIKDGKIVEAFHDVDVAGIRMDMGVLQPSESLPRRHY